MNLIRFLLNLFLALFLVAILPAVLPGSAHTTVVLSNQTRHVHLGFSMLEILEDPHRKWDLEAVSSRPLSDRFVPAKGRVSNFGITSSAYWARFSVRNEALHRDDWLLVCTSPLIERVDLFIPGPGNEYIHRTGGTQVPWNRKVVKHFHPMFPLKMDPGSEWIVTMRFETRSTMFLGVSIWKPGAFIEHDQNQHIVFGLILGTLAVLAVLNLLFFLFLKDRAYLYYVLFILSFGIYQMVLSGLAEERLWPGFPWWTVTSPVVFAGIVAFFGLLFTRSFLNTRDNSPGIDRVILILTGASAFCSILAFLNVPLARTLVSYVAMILITVIIAASILFLRRGVRPARYFLAAWILFFLSAFCFSLAVIGAIEPYFLALNSMPLGFCLGGFVLSLALMDRFREIRKQHEKELETQVEQRTGELQRTVGTLNLEASERKQAVEALRQSEAILEAVGTSAERFLRVGSPEKEKVQDFIVHLGLVTDVSRIYIFENHPGEDGALLASQRFEWTAPGIESQMDNPDLHDVSWQEGGMGRWVDIMGRGGIIQGHVKDFPASEKEILVPQAIQSIVAVPIFVGGDWWGFVGLDECKGEREWSGVEIDALKATGAILGAMFEHGRARKALLASEERYRVLAETAREIILILDLEGRVVYVNRSGLDMSGYNEQELSGKDIKEVVPEDQLERIAENLARRKTGEKGIFLYEAEFIHKEGKRIPVEVSSTLLVEQDRPSGVMLVARDISERNRAEEALRESEEKYRNVVENVNEGILVIQEGAPLFANKAILDYLGCTLDEFLSLPVMEMVHPEDREMVLERHMARLSGEESPEIYPYRIVKRDGTVIWVEVTGIRINWMGATATLNFFRDVTGRKQVEQEREKLITELQEAISKVKLLSGLLPICSSCNKIRDDEGYWKKIEIYIREHSEADFSHSICPECAKKLYPEFAGKIYPESFEDDE